ncbi:hypothetical protein, partial [Snuella lapsa]|uniref:hypothetical protein n=1 Tax=Snuella lapsa TaxID=870481 RepID=UPI0031EFA226
MKNLFKIIANNVKVILTPLLFFVAVLGNGGILKAQNATTTWSVGDVIVDCATGQVCYPIMVQSDISNTQLSYTTLRFFYDSALMNNLTISSVENTYTVDLVDQSFPAVGDEFGFTTDTGGFPRISITPNVSNYLDIQNGVPTHVFDLCFTILLDPIPGELCSPLIFDNEHTTAGTGIANDDGYFYGDKGIATQYVVGGGGSAVAADDEAIQFLWTGDVGFDGQLDTLGETVGSVATTGCIQTGCLGSISGQVLADSDGDGIGDTALVGETIQLTYAGPDGIFGNGDDVVVLTTTSDGTTDLDGDGFNEPAGSYYFGDLLPGEYLVEETDPVGYISVSDDDTIVDGADDGETNNGNTNDNIIPVSLVAGEYDSGNNFVDLLPNPSIAVVKDSPTQDTYSAVGEVINY